jgi:hypothetical protein
MEVTTVLGRVFKSEWSKDVTSILTLIIDPREIIKVRQGEIITEEQFNDLKHNAAFISLTQNTYQQLPIITAIIQPFARTGYSNTV